MEGSIEEEKEKQCPLQEEDCEKDLGTKKKLEKSIFDRKCSIIEVSEEQEDVFIELQPPLTVNATIPTT